MTESKSVALPLGHEVKLYKLYVCTSNWKKFTILTALIMFGMQSVNNMDDYLLKLTNYLLYKI